MKPRQLRSSIAAAGAVAVAAIVSAAIYDGWRLHQQIMAANERELGNLAEALTTGTQRSIQAVDVLLRDTAIWYESGGRHLDSRGVDEALKSRVVGVSQVTMLSVVDSTGRQRFRSRATSDSLSDVSDRQYFARQRDEPNAGLVISEPVVSRATGEPALVLSRPLRASDGSFDGIVAAIVTLQELQSTYAAIHLGGGSAMLLTLSDGTLIVRQPPLPAASAVSRFPELAGLRGGALVGRVRSPVDGRTKLIAVLAVGVHPLILAVTRDEQEALKPWHDEMTSAAIRTSLFVLLVIAATLGLRRQLRLLERGAIALHESEERYAMAMEAANEGHAEWNMREGSVFVSTKWCVLHGLDPTAIIKRDDDLIERVAVHPEDVAAVRSAVDEHLTGQAAAIDVEYRVRQVDGDWRWVQARGRCVRDPVGVPSRLFCAANDITARKAAEVAKASFDMRLQQAHRMEALGTLAGGIAHDFNNILGAILGFGDMAQQLAATGTPLRRHIDRVLQAGGRAKALVRRVLDFSRSGVVEQVPVNIQMVVEEALALQSPGLPPGVRMDMTLAADSIAVSSDATQLHQVVMNLCTNAIQAIGDQGTLHVDLRLMQVEETMHLLHGELAPGAYARLCISDTGPGIEAEVLSRIFEPFFTTKKAGEGTGLGLSVVHGIVVHLGGAIDVSSTVGVGTQVSVWLPMAIESAAILAEDGSEWPRGAGQVVMIVDDERPLVEFGEELLAELGYSPLAFESGQAALTAFLDDPSNIDALLTDESMPGMTGSELARAVLAQRPDLPVMMMSGHVVVGLEQRALKAGICKLLHKPLTARELAQCLAQCLADRPTSNVGSSGESR